jgi:hypothetical protein
MGWNWNVFMKVDKTVIKETKYIAAFVMIFSVLMQAIFLIINKWDYTVLLCNIYGAAVAIGNFFAMGLFVQKAVSQEEKDARQTVKASQSIRMALVFILLAIGVIVFKQTPARVATVIPLILPRIAIVLRVFTDKNK